MATTPPNAGTSGAATGSDARTIKPDPKASKAGSKPPADPKGAAPQTPGPQTPAPKTPAPKGAGSKPAATSNAKLGVDIAILWRGDMLAAQFFSRPQTVTVGPKGTFTMPEEVIGKPLQTLVESGTSAGFGLRIDNDKAAGHLIINGEVHDLGEVRSGKVSGVKGPVIPLSAGTRAVLVFGDFTFIVSRVPVPPPTKFSLWNKEMLPFLLCWLFALVLTGGPLAAAFNSPEYLRRAKLTFQEKQADRLSELVLVEVKEEPPPEEEDAKKEEEKPKAPELKPQEPEKKPEVKKEEAEIKKEEKEIDKQLDSVTDEEEKDKLVKKIVAAKVDEATAEVDAALDAVNNQMIGTKLFAEADDDGGQADPANPNSGKGGAEVMADPLGKTQGAGLMEAGRKKTAMNSGDATKKRVIKGLGKDSKAGKDVKIGMKTRQQKVVRVGGGSGSKATGELPKKVIQKYIRRKMGAIKACYQKGLQANPNLQGKVKVLFLIQPSGQVMGAKVKDSSINSPNVESCILKNVKAWKFPRAKGGGTTKVLYPFRFSSR